MLAPVVSLQRVILQKFLQANGTFIIFHVHPGTLIQQCLVTHFFVHVVLVPVEVGLLDAVVFLGASFGETLATIRALEAFPHQDPFKRG